MTAIAAWLLLCPFAGLLIRLSVKSEWVAAQLALVGAPLLLLCRLRTSGLAPRKPASVNVNFACFISIPHISPARTRPWEASLPTPCAHTLIGRSSSFLTPLSLSGGRVQTTPCSSDTSGFCTYPICCLSVFYFLFLFLFSFFVRSLTPFIVLVISSIYYVFVVEQSLG